jgi:hypothetical protein
MMLDCCGKRSTLLLVKGFHWCFDQVTGRDGCFVRQGGRGGGFVVRYWSVEFITHAVLLACRFLPLCGVLGFTLWSLGDFEVDARRMSSGTGSISDGIRHAAANKSASQDE